MSSSGLLERVTPNPFATAVARRISMYATRVDGALVRRLDPTRAVSAHAVEVHDTVVATVLDPQFSCLGAKSAVRKGSYRFSLYPALGTPDATAGLAYDLYTFVREYPDSVDPYITFVAAFDGPHVHTEQQFEDIVWEQLQTLHDVDTPHFGWDPSVASDPQHADFSFSFAGTAFFVVGLFAGSGRWTRRFAVPTLVFNFHRQFEALRTSGQFERLRDTIRDRERAGQGDVYAMLTDFGTLSEARSYTGRVVEPEWQCPFHAQLPDDEVGP